MVDRHDEPMKEASVGLADSNPPNGGKQFPTRYLEDNFSDPLHRGRVRALGHEKVLQIINDNQDDKAAIPSMLAAAAELPNGFSSQLHDSLTGSHLTIKDLPLCLKQCGESVQVTRLLCTDRSLHAFR